MQWVKKGRIYIPDENIEWRSKYGMMPTPLLLESTGIIRIYFGVTNSERYGSTTFVDVDMNDPKEIISDDLDQPVISFGDPGYFDDSGVIPSSIIESDKGYLLYYVGFQRCHNVPYMLFPGLAISQDGTSFHRHSSAPIIERTDKFPVSLAAPCVIYDEGIYKMWLWIGNNWLDVNGKLYINASIGYGESTDGFHWEVKSTDCIVPNVGDEFSVGRPWVSRKGDSYEMFYSVRYRSKLYRLGYAKSQDGIEWDRLDEEIGIDVSLTGWDSEMICYPSVLTVKDKTYLFYNGNSNGETGFGYAELVNS